MKRIFSAGLILLFLDAGRPAHGNAEVSADSSGAAGALFRQGRTRLSVGAGYGVFNKNDYFVLGLGAGYYFIDGLEAGLDGETWIGSQPQIYNVSPQIRYILPEILGFRPYAGGFYRRTFYSRELANLNSAGARAGLVFPLSPRTYITAGAVYEHYFKCDTAIYSTCDNLYPEAGISFAY
jgi:hypothetical protein